MWRGLWKSLCDLLRFVVDDQLRTERFGWLLIRLTWCAIAFLVVWDLGQWLLSR
jgi:hypothetical protein